MEKGGRKS